MDLHINNNAEKLKPCPFCGGEAKMYFMPGANNGFGFAQVGCKRCNITQIGTDFRTWKAAAEAWNRRVNEAKNGEEISDRTF